MMMPWLFKSKIFVFAVILGFILTGGFYFSLGNSLNLTTPLLFFGPIFLILMVMAGITGFRSFRTFWVGPLGWYFGVFLANITFWIFDKNFSFQLVLIETGIFGMFFVGLVIISAISAGAKRIVTRFSNYGSENMAGTTNKPE